ncbi:MAG: Peptidase family M23 [bacterium ADurb.Bin212]|nr:MAG: Peptidase family M23 [bacterium ADurb.Bin212]
MPELTIATFLTLPFTMGTRVAISQGWLYSMDEVVIHPGITHHNGVDFACPWGTRVLVPADGVAVASYHTYYMGDFHGRLIGYGLGLFVQIWHPEAQLFTSYAHLSKASKEIPYISPVRQGDSWQPAAAIYVPLEVFLAQGVEVKRGDYLGEVGRTGLLLHDETPSNPPATKATDPTWDPAGDHLHWECYRRTLDGLRKDPEARCDPFGVYGLREAYNINKASGLLLAGPKGRPLWANE